MMEQKWEYYQDGNAIRKRLITIEPEEALLNLPRQEEKPQGLPVQKPVRINWPKVGAMLLLSVLTLAFAFLSVTFLKLNAGITESGQRIYQMEKTLAALKAENAMTVNRAEAELDLASVYEIATGRLGMVHADGNEQITYQQQLREYVRQYENIPGK